MTAGNLTRWLFFLTSAQWAIFTTSLTPSSSEIELPAMLEHLEVNYCLNLDFLSRNGNLPEALNCLRVRFCSKLESLAKRLDNTSLEEITISWLENLKLLPGGLHNLHRLQEIRIERCPNLFRRMVFPPTFNHLWLMIWRCVSHCSNGDWTDSPLSDCWDD